MPRRYNSDSHHLRLVTSSNNVPDASLTLLPQIYEKRTATTYWYESPQGPYSALLELAESGFVRKYPGLWALEE